MKNTLDGLNSRMEMTEERNSEPDRSIEIIQYEQKRGKEKEKTEQKRFSGIYSKQTKG